MLLWSYTTSYIYIYKTLQTTKLTYTTSYTWYIIYETLQTTKYKQNNIKGETERAEQSSSIQKYEHSVHTTVLNSTIYTSPQGTDRITVYFNAHTSV